MVGLKTVKLCAGRAEVTELNDRKIQNPARGQYYYGMQILEREEV